MNRRKWRKLFRDPVAFYRDARGLAPLRARVAPLQAWLLRSPWLSGTGMVLLLVIFYWGVWASDRYESVSHLVIERAEHTGGGAFDVGVLLAGGGSNSRDLYLLRDYLTSADMLALLDQKLGLRVHYSDRGRDMFSRMPAGASREDFLRHYQLRVRAEIDDMTGILYLKVQAYTPEMAKAIADAVVAEGERYMNVIGQRMALEQVAFIEAQAAEMGERADAARRKALEFQNANRLASPQAAMESLSAAIGGMEQEISSLRAERMRLASYLSAQSPDVVQIDARIRALEQQVANDRARLAAPGGNKLNAVTEAYASLQREAEFAAELYRSTLTAFEKLRVDATRKLKYVAILQQPTLPEEALYPRRLYSILTFTVVLLLLAGIFRLIQTVIREHKD